MRCDQAMEAWTARLAEPDRGAPPGGLDEELDRHLQSCPRCRREAEETRALWERLGSLEIPSEEVPSEALRDRFETMLAGYRAAVADTGDGRSAAGRSGDRSGRGRLLGWSPRSGAGKGSDRTGSEWMRLAAAASVALAVLAGGVAGGWWLADGGRGGDLDALRAEVRSLHDMVALSMLDRPEATDRLRGVSFGARSTRDAGDGGAGGGDRAVVAALVETVARDPNVHVRLAAVDALTPVAGDPAVRDALVRTLPEQGSPMVQIALADLLLDADGAAARRGVGTLLEDPDLHPEVRRHLERRLGRST